MESPTSNAVAPISMATTPCEISSPAPGPTIPIPNTRFDSGSTINLVSPSLRCSVLARPDADQGKRATFTSRFSFFACCSVRPHQAISGFVNTTAGIASGSNAERAQTWKLYYPPEFAAAKAADEQLYAQGLPNALDLPVDTP